MRAVFSQAHGAVHGLGDAHLVTEHCCLRCLRGRPSSEGRDTERESVLVLLDNELSQSSPDLSFARAAPGSVVWGAEGSVGDFRLGENTSSSFLGHGTHSPILPRLHDGHGDPLHEHAVARDDLRAERVRDVIGAQKYDPALPDSPRD